MKVMTTYVNEVEITKYEPKLQLPKSGVILIVARTDSGKTVLVRDLLKHCRKRCYLCIAMVGSLDTAAEYSMHIPNTFIYNQFDEKRLEQMYAQAEKWKAEGKTRYITIVLDDLMFLGKSMLKSEILKKIFFNCRHANILLFLVLQDSKGIGPDHRAQIRDVFLLQEKNPELRKRIYQSYNPCFHSFKEFDYVCRALTQNYEAMVIRNVNTGSDTVESNVFWYKAQYPVKKFRIPTKKKNKKVWQYNRKYFNVQYLKKKQTYDILVANEHAKETTYEKNQKPLIRKIKKKRK